MHIRLHRRRRAALRILSRGKGSVMLDFVAYKDLFVVDIVVGFAVR
jgi:hypothetical protein